jgi:hypothetical protein
MSFKAAVKEAWFFTAIQVKDKVKETLRLTVSQSVCLGGEPRLGLMTRYLFTL